MATPTARKPRTEITSTPGSPAANERAVRDANGPKPGSGAKARETKQARERREQPPATNESLKVRATRMGIYGHQRRRENDVFTLDAAKDFNPSWMVREDAKTPVKTTTGREHLRQKHDEILRSQQDKGGAADTSRDDKGNLDNI